jgi:hypothetical protein
MQLHECNKYNYLCINDSLKILFPCENQGVTMVHNGLGSPTPSWDLIKITCFGSNGWERRGWVVVINRNYAPACEGSPR